MTNPDYSEHRYLSQDGLLLYYREYGDVTSPCTPILCLAGVTRNSADFHDLARHLSPHHRVLALDLRGRGQSEYDPDPSHYRPTTYLSDIAHLLTAANCNHVIVIGTSLGGMLAMAMGATKPTALKGVILNDIGPEIDNVGLDRIRGYLGKASTPSTMEEAAENMKAIYGAAFPDLGFDSWLAQAKNSYTIDPNGKLILSYDADIASNAGDVSDLDLWPFFNALLHIPLLALRGELSDILNAKTLQNMQAANPNMTAVTIENRGHAPLLDEPDSLAAIDAFISSIEKSKT